MAIRQLRITRPQFLNYQRSFYRNIVANKLYCEMTIITRQQGNTSYDEFIGNTPATEVTYRVPLLFDFEATGQSREKFGIAEDIDSVVYISPLSLKKLSVDPRMRDYKNRVRIKFKDERFLLDSVMYLEELFGSFVALQLNLKTDRKGG